LISAAFFKDPSDPQWLSDGGVLEYLAFMKQHYPRGDPNELYNYWGYSYAQTLAQVLKQCGDNLTRENVMRQAADLKDLGLPMLLPGIKINTGPTDYYPIKQLQMIRFDGAKWVRVGEILGN
jgi:branched-chain amino acid transport system substrate-binding protein